MFHKPKTFCMNAPKSNHCRFLRKLQPRKIQDVIELAGVFADDGDHQEDVSFALMQFVDKNIVETRDLAVVVFDVIAAFEGDAALSNPKFSEHERCTAGCGTYLLLKFSFL